MKRFLRICVLIVLLSGVHITASHGQTSCTGMNNNINTPSPLCLTSAPTTIAQPAAVTFPPATVVYDWEMATSSPTAPYVLLGAPSQDLPVPTAPGTYYFIRVASVVGPSVPGTPVLSCESNAVRIMIVSPPSISANSPASADVCSGAGTSFSIAVSATGPTGSQWQYEDGTGFTDIPSGNSTYSGANTNTLTVSSAAGLGNKNFRCVVTSTVNADCQTESAIFSLHEKPLPVVSPLRQMVCESVNAIGGGAVVDLNTFNSALTASDPNNLFVSWFASAPRTSISDPANFQFSTIVMLTANVVNATTFCATDAAVALITKPFPTATAVIQSPANLCSGEHVDVALDGASQYDWTVTAPANVQGAASGQGAAIYQALTNHGAQRQKVTYVIVPKQGDCAGPPIEVATTVEPEIKKFAVTGGGEICSGNSGVTIGLLDSQPDVDYTLEQDGRPTGISLTSLGGPFVYPNPVASGGTFTIQAAIDGVCETNMDGSAVVTVRTVPGGIGSIMGDEVVCRGASYAYEASGWTDATDYRWIVPTQMRSVTEEDQAAEIVAEQTGDVQLQAVGINACGAGPTATKKISIRDNPVVTIHEPHVVVVDQALDFDYNATTPLAQWRWNFGDGGTSTGQYPEHTYDKPGPYVVTLNGVDENGCLGSNTLNIAVTFAISSNNIKNVITANGDSQNGYLIVENLEKFPDNEVVFLSRWGNEVFRKKGYANDWDARVGGYFLPAGNYICIVRIAKTNDVFSRVVTVVKD
jgi:hypothetical protein